MSYQVKPENERKRCLFFTILILATLASALAKVPQESVSKVAPVVFVAIDGSGSYDFFDKCKDKLRALIDALPPGSELFLRLITADSYLDTNIILTSALPVNKEASDNPFDAKVKLRTALFRNEIRKVKEQIMNTLFKMNYPQSSRTDIFGFLIYVQEKFRERYQKCHRRTEIFLFTDLLNNVETYRKWLEDGALSGTKIYVCGFKQSVPEIKRTWAKIFSQLGVNDVMYWGIDEDIPVMPIFAGVENSARDSK